MKQRKQKTRYWRDPMRVKPGERIIAEKVGDGFRITIKRCRF